jgi:hypothetical protein
MTSTNPDFKVVGSSCLSEFLGCGNPQEIIALAELVFSLDDIMSDSESEGGGKVWVDLKTYLAFVCSSIRNDGWLSTKASYETGGSPTKVEADVLMDKAAKGECPASHKPTEADFNRVDTALAFMDTFLATHAEDSDYFHNLSVIAKLSSIDCKMMGIAASVIVTAEREMGKEIERRKCSNLKETSKYLGEIGGKIIATATVVMVRELETRFGVSTLVKFVSNGSSLTWFASGNVSGEFEVGKEYMVWGKVKKHEEYQGVKGTVITRVSIVTQEIVDAENAKATKKAARLAKKLAAGA